jgi:nitrogen fixation/metabolism regulation signal transduction histidine kinase
VLAQWAGFARRRARRPALRDLRALLEHISPVLVHVTGDDITWAMAIGDEPMHVSLDASELEHCLAAIVTQGREALPLGGQITLSLRAAPRDGDARDGRGARPDVVVAIEQPDHLTTRLVLRLARVFVTH